MGEMIARTQFGFEVKIARKNRRWNQEQLSKKLNSVLPKEHPIHFTQGSISKLERGNPDLQLTELAVLKLQDILTLTSEVVDPLLAELREIGDLRKTKHTYISVHEAGQLISKSAHPEFAPYLGEYYCFFVSTNSSDRKLVNGKLEIADDRGQCTAFMTIFDDNSKEIKWYSGPFFINRHYRTWHCILVGRERQEICMLTSIHFNSTIEPNLLSMALVLTTSSGTQKRPTMHRMLMSRKAIPKTKLGLIQAQLRLNSDSITISESTLEQLRRETKKDLQRAKGENSRSKYQAVLTCIDKIKELGTNKGIYTIAESIIYDSDTIVKDERLRSFVVSRIRFYSESEYYNKVSQTVLDICADIIKTR